jgi:hypothetical protein
MYFFQLLHLLNEKMDMNEPHSKWLKGTIRNLL